MEASSPFAKKLQRFPDRHQVRTWSPPDPPPEYLSSLPRDDLPSNNPYRVHVTSISSRPTASKKRQASKEPLSFRRSIQYNDDSDISPMEDDWFYNYLDAPQQHESREGQWPLSDYVDMRDMPFEISRKDSVICDPLFAVEQGGPVSEVAFLGYVGAPGRLLQESYRGTHSKTRQGWACTRCGQILPKRNVYPGVLVCQICATNDLLSRPWTDDEGKLLSPSRREQTEGDALTCAAATAACRRRRKQPPQWLHTGSQDDLSRASSLAHLETAGVTATRTCVSCADELPSESFVSDHLTSGCIHENAACRSCVQQWIETQHINQGWDRIKCIECPEYMAYSDILRHATNELFDRYDQLVTRAALSNEPGFVWCRNPRCGSGQIHEGGEDMPLFQCSTCRVRHCVACNEPWHEDETCSAFASRMNGESSPDGAQAEHDGNDVVSGWARYFEPTREPQAINAHRPATGRSSLEDEDTAEYALALHLSLREHDERTDESSNRPASRYIRGFDMFVGTETGLLQSQRSVKFKGFMKKWLLKDLAPTRNPKPATTPQSEQAYQYQWNASVFDTSTNQSEDGDAQTKQDALAAKFLHREFEREDKQRSQKEQQRMNTQRITRERQEAAEEERKAYQRRKADERKGEETVRSISKSCPRCRWNIQKKSGCDHVRTPQSLRAGRIAD